jgi:hypothetical protein
VSLSAVKRLKGEDFYLRNAVFLSPASGDAVDICDKYGVIALYAAPMVF